MAGELAARSAARLLSAALLLTCCARGSDAFRAGGTVLGARQRPESASACPRPRALRARGAPVCARGLQGARVPRAGAGARAAGGVRMQSTDPQWYAFQGYNLGTWAGTAMHIDPETGDYAQPYVIRQYSLEVTEVQDKDGRESAVEKLVAEATKTLPALETSKTVAADDDFDATPDGAYSLDRRGVRVPDTSTTANLLVEMSIPMSDDERVRCELVYGADSELERIILREEIRIPAAPAAPAPGASQSKLSAKLGGDKQSKDDKEQKGKQNGNNEVNIPVPERTIRAPLELGDIIGTLSEQVSSRRTWRLGGGFIKYQSKSTLTYDGDTRVRRVSTASTEKGATDPELTTSKWGETSTFSKVIDFDDGRMVLMPSGCWVKAPRVLLKKDGTKVGSLSVLDILQATEDSEDDETFTFVDDVQSFTVEFGVYGSDAELQHCRTSRLYGEDGRLSSTSLAFAF